MEICIKSVNAWKIKSSTYIQLTQDDGKLQVVVVEHRLTKTCRRTSPGIFQSKDWISPSWQWETQFGWLFPSICSDWLRFSPAHLILYQKVSNDWKRVGEQLKSGLLRFNCFWISFYGVNCQKLILLKCLYRYLLPYSFSWGNSLKRFPLFFFCGFLPSTTLFRSNFTFLFILLSSVTLWDLLHLDRPRTRWCSKA